MRTLKRRRPLSRGMLIAFLATMLAAATVSAAAPTPVQAQTNACATKVTSSGSSIVGGVSTCYYIVFDDARTKMCEGVGGSLSCTGLQDDTYEVEAYQRSPWSKLDTYNVTVGGGTASNACDTKVTSSGSSIIGGVSTCYYIVFNSARSKMCEGIGGSLPCTNLADQTYEVEAYQRSPWTKLDTYNVTVDDDGPGNPGTATPRNENPRFSKFANTPSDSLSSAQIADLTANYETDDQLRDSTHSGGDVGDGNFRVTCQYSHFNYDDPILRHGQQGRPNNGHHEHLHMFFGNTEANAFTSSIKSSPNFITKSGGGSCNGFELNRSAYWTPAVLDGKGNAVVPYNITVYYKTKTRGDQPNNDAANAAVMEEGLKLISGNGHHLPSLNELTETSEHVYWSCGANGNVVTKYNYIPSQAECGSEPINATIYFPQCWNGNTDNNGGGTQDQTDLMIVPEFGECPTGYKRMPRLGILMYFANQDTTGWRLSSDKSQAVLDASPDLRPGGTLHADWIGGWHEETIDGWNTKCVRGKKNCQIAQTDLNVSLRRLRGTANDDFGSADGTGNHTLSDYLVPIADIDASLTFVEDDAMDNAIAALESYAGENGTYRVDGGGNNGAGQGWFHYANNTRYTQGVGEVLVNEGHAASLSSLQDELYIDSTKVRGDFLIYRCKDRVGVFSRHGDGSTTSASDAAWWTANGCTRHPIDRLNGRDYQVSVPLAVAQQERRSDVMDNAIAALESYGAANNTYRVNGGGYNGAGQGWFHYDNNTRYTQGVGEVLVNQGHAASIADLEAPTHIDSTRTRDDFLIYRCKTRVAVFSRNGGTAVASTADQAWWDNNGCTRTPIDRLNARYFKLSAPLS